MAITAAQLRAFAPDASPKIVAGIIANQQFMVDAEITTPLRIRHFMAQAATETGGLARLEENLNYSAKRLTVVWSKRFPTIAAATPYAKNPRKLANKVYGGRLGNDTKDDGWTYRGSGILQTTGEGNFAEVEKETGMPVVAQPELLRTFPGALQAACIYWAQRKINKRADADDVVGVTEAVNGGHNGLDDRKAWLAKARKVWPDKPASARPAALATIVPIVPKPAPAPAPVADSSIIEDVQRKLTALNYNPGGADGKIGPLTAGAIRIFRADHNMPEGDFIDSDFITALQTAAPRKMVPERANATAAQVAAKVPEVRANALTKIGAAIVAIPGAIFTVGVNSLDYIGVARSYVQPLQDAAYDVSGPVWIGIITMIAVGLAFWAWHGEKKGVEAYKSGDRR